MSDLCPCGATKFHEATLGWLKTLVAATKHDEMEAKKTTLDETL